MNIFDKTTRTYLGPKTHSETEYDYLNRSARAYCSRIRELLERWLDSYPSDDMDELISRFRASDDHGYYSAFFELYLHELNRKLGFDLHVHPEVEGDSHRPDFLVSHEGQDLFYLEATLSKNSDDEVAAQRRINKVYDTINRLISPDYFLEVKIEGSPASDPPGAKWREFLKRKINNLDYNQLEIELEKNGLDALPSWKRDHDGWEVTFRPIPKMPEARGKPDVRPIGVHWFANWELDEDEGIKSSIKEKAGRYGDLKLPYIIAINVMSMFFRDLSVANALYGQFGHTAYKHMDGSIHTKPRRKKNGAWGWPSSPKNTRVSGVLIFDYLSPNKVPEIMPVLWHHPNAKYPVDINTLPFHQRIWNTKTDKIELIKGRSLRDVFRLPENWPNNK